MRLIGNAEYDFIAKLVYSQSRIQLGTDKKSLVTARLNKRLNQLNLPDFQAYCQLLSSSEGRGEIGQMLDLISTNFTHFFREPKHFEFLVDHILPEWTKRPSHLRTPFRVWSAGCSTGEEPYSLAIVLADYYKSLSPVMWEVMASDLSTRVLSSAEQGVYPASHIRKVKTDWLREYFRKGIDQWEGYYRLKPALRSQVHFQQVNLFQPTFPFKAGFHVIFCRNVMIYFDRTTRQDLLKRLARSLVPGGYLVVGHAEGLTHVSHSFNKVIPSVFQKPI